MYAAADSAKPTAAKAFEDTPGRSLWKRLDFAWRTWDLHGSPPGEGRPFAAKSEACRAFSDELKSIFQTRNLAPFKAVNSDHEAYLAALQTMKTEAATQWRKVDKFSTWGKEARQRLMEFTVGKDDHPPE